MSHSHLHESRPELGRPGSIQFIRQLLIRDAERPFELELAGSVRTSGEAVAPSILPVGRVVLDGGAPRSEALVTAAVADERGLDRAIGRLTDHIGTTRPKRFAIRLAAPKRSFTEIVSMAEDAFGSGGCGCGCGGGAAPGAVTLGSIAVGLAPTEEDELAWSDPVAAQIRAWVDYDGGLDRSDVVASIGSWFFDCYSEWVGVIDRATICRGSCTKNTCQCGKTCDGFPRTTCIGWNFCFCL